MGDEPWLPRLIQIAVVIERLSPMLLGQRLVLVIEEKHYLRLVSSQAPPWNMVKNDSDVYPDNNQKKSTIQRARNKRKHQDLPCTRK
jgi:hypothetical protein